MKKKTGGGGGGEMSADLINKSDVFEVLRKDRIDFMR